MNGLSCPPDTLYVCAHNPQCEYVVSQLKEHGYWGNFKVVIIHSISTKHGEFIPLDETNMPISMPPVIVGTPTFLFFVHNQAKVLKGTHAILEYFKIEDSSNTGTSTGKPNHKTIKSTVVGSANEDGVKAKKLPFVSATPNILDNPAAANVTYTPIVPGVVYDKNAIGGVQHPGATDEDPAANAAPSYGGMRVISQSEKKAEEMTKRLNDYNQKINEPFTYGN